MIPMQRNRKNRSQQPGSSSSDIEQAVAGDVSPATTPEQQVIEWLERGDFHEDTAQALRHALDTVMGSLKQPNIRRGGRGDVCWALCPYHPDTRVGSFNLCMQTGMFKCWVCGARGGLVTLLRSFGLWNDDWEGVKSRLIASTSPAREVKPLQTLPPSLLWAWLGKLPLRYLYRKHSAKVLTHMEVGYCPELERICFPIRDARGALVGVQSRLAHLHFGHSLRWKLLQHELVGISNGALSEEDIRDYVSPRPRVFYNEHHVLPSLACGDLPQVVIVEGMGAALRCMGAGLPVLATFGTEIASGQLEKLVGACTHARRVTGQVPTMVLAQDGDAPGKAAQAVTALKLSPYASIRLARLPDFADPEDLSPAQLRRVEGSATHLQSTPPEDLDLTAWGEILSPEKPLTKRPQAEEYDADLLAWILTNGAT